MRLILVSLVKNEADIIRSNVLWHFGCGVDFIIVTDNGSNDGTQDILREYERQGRLLLVEDNSEFNQGELVTRMAELARDRYDADWIIPGDADELWVPKTGDLKSEIDHSDENILTTTVVNLVPTSRDDQGVDDPVRRLRFKVSKPPAIPRIPYVLKRIQRKVMFRAADFTRVLDGNHKVEVRNPRRGDSRNVIIFHYPIRSRAQFFRKVREGGEALERASRVPKETGYHWRRWYDQYQAGKLDVEWNRQRLGSARLLVLRALGVVEEDRTVERRVARSTDGPGLMP
jgi:glycosyltransferase involved in cell wall biosynthesis